jgi:uncharacterized protein
MESPVDAHTLKSIEAHDDGVVLEFYRRLREERRLCSTHCTRCSKTSYPPRAFCPHCFGESLDWVEIGAGATLYAFTTQTRALRFTAPDVIGVVDLPGIGRILTRIDAPFESLRIGQAMRFAPLELSEKLVVHSFAPVVAR